MTAPPHTLKHFFCTVIRHLTPALLATLLMACGAKSGPEDAASGWAASIANASVAEDSAMAVAESESPPDATLQQLAPRVDEGLKRFGVMPHVNDLDTMVDRRVIRILTVQVAVIPVARDQLFSALKAGYGDIVMAGTTITENRRSESAFTAPVSKPLKEILVTGPSAPPLETLESLAGKTVHVRLSSSYVESIRALNDRLIKQDLAPVRIEAMDESLEDEDLIEMVDAGLLPWAIVDDYKPQMWREVFTRTVVRDDLVLRSGGRLAWAVRPSNPKLLRFLNTFVKDNREGTLFGNIIRNRYIRDFDWAENAIGAEELSRYRALSSYFIKYGANYGIDPTLLAAQGFQESRLDQSVRSHVGAVGVMQLLPSTAKDKNVAIPNIEEVEPNIEAGAKYMAFLKSRYFSGPEIDELNGALISLAAYNAGPGRIRRLRREAEERGYDPNLWFDNVEVIVAEQVGRETVQYVSNIFKYYLTYRWINVADAERAAARKASGID